MFYIYHIPGIKIGCSTQPDKRVQKQGYTQFEIIEQWEDIHTASKREMELQKEWGYRVDNTPYSQSYEWCNKGYSKGGLVTAQKLVESGEWERRRQRGVKKAAQLSSKPILVYKYPSGEFHSEWPSIISCSKEMNLDRTTMIRMLAMTKGKRFGNRPYRHHKGYTFQYKNKE